MRRALSLVLALAISASCDDCVDGPIETLEPEIEVVPEPVLDMGERPVARGSDDVITVRNTGTAVLDIQDVRVVPYLGGDAIEGPFVDDQAAVFAVSDLDRVLNNQEDVIIVTVNPTTQGRFAATVVIENEDVDEREVLVHVLAVGGPPRIAVNPESLDFGTVNEGPGAARTIEVQNIGFDNLSVSNMRIEGSGGFSLEAGTDTSPTIPVEQSATVTVRLDPSAAAVAAAGGSLLNSELVIESDAENAAELRVPLAGEVNLAPTAVAVELFSRQTVVKSGVGAQIIVDGSESVDPEGDAFTFSWELERPDDSFAVLFAPPTADACTEDATCDANEGFLCDIDVCKQLMRTRFIPDRVGNYTVTLRATDARGAFSEATVEVRPKDLALVLRWETAADATCQSMTVEQCEALSPAERRQVCCGQTDFDLHLVRPSGSLGDYGTCPVECIIDDGTVVENRCAEEGDTFVDTCRQLGTDVAFANRFPEWGQTGRADDPRLDVDDVRGEGPEIISLNEPEDGAYTAYVHFCTDRITEPTLATLEFIVEGELAATAGPQRIDTENQVWIAASLLRENGAWDIVTVPDLFEPNPPAGLCEQ